MQPVSNPAYDPYSPAHLPTAAGIATIGAPGPFIHSNVPSQPIGQASGFQVMGRPTPAPVLAAHGFSTPAATGYSQPPLVPVMQGYARQPIAVRQAQNPIAVAQTTYAVHGAPSVVPGTVVTPGAVVTPSATHSVVGAAAPAVINQRPLPPGWEERVTETGRTYYVVRPERAPPKLPETT